MERKINKIDYDDIKMFMFCELTKLYRQPTDKWNNMFLFFRKAIIDIYATEMKTHKFPMKEGSAIGNLKRSLATNGMKQKLYDINRHYLNLINEWRVKMFDKGWRAIALNLPIGKNHMSGRLAYSSYIDVVLANLHTGKTTCIILLDEYENDRRPFRALIDIPIMEDMLDVALKDYFVIKTSGLDFVPKLERKKIDANQKMYGQRILNELMLRYMNEASIPNVNNCKTCRYESQCKIW